MTSLTPALEMEAGTYATQDRPLPSESGEECPQAWHKYWVDSLADSGIVGLKPLPAGYVLVVLSSLTNPTFLRTILRQSLKHMTDWDLETIRPLPGGYVLEHEDQWIASACCSDLSTLSEWSNAAAHTGEMWSMVWIGHPWTHVRATGDVLHFAEPSESTPGDISALSDAVCLSRQDLLSAIEKARAERRAFGERLLPLIEELGPPVAADKVLKVLLLGHHHGVDEAI